MSADDLVQRGAEVTERVFQASRQGKTRYDWTTGEDVAQALVERGWHDGPKLTDAERAVLDAAVRESARHQSRPAVNAVGGPRRCVCDLCNQVRARREAGR